MSMRRSMGLLIGTTVAAQTWMNVRNATDWLYKAFAPLLIDAIYFDAVARHVVILVIVAILMTNSLLGHKSRAFADFGYDLPNTGSYFPAGILPLLYGIVF